MNALNASLASMIVLVLIAMLFNEWTRPADSTRHLDDDPRLVGVNPHGRIAATGWIEGRTANVEIRSRLTEQIKQVLVQEGDWVAENDVLVQLDASVFSLNQQVAAADLAQAQAQLQRVENGFRQSEIDEARNHYAASLAELEGAKKNLSRLAKLVDSNIVSPQAYDEETTRVEALAGKMAAARNRLENLAQSPREDDLDAARASVSAAQSRLSLAEVQLQRATIRSPLKGQVLRVNCLAGELATAETPEPLVILSDTGLLRGVVEVDEFDALRVRVGQRASVRVNSLPGVVARGVVVDIEPQMSRKQLYSDRPGERMDTFSRRVWINLESGVELPIGLPIDVIIAAEPPANDQALIAKQTTVAFRSAKPAAHKAPRG